MTQDKIADRDTERRNFSVRVLFGIYGTSYGATLALPQQGCAHHVFFIYALQQLDFWLAYSKSQVVTATVLFTHGEYSKQSGGDNLMKS